MMTHMSDVGEGPVIMIENGGGSRHQEVGHLPPIVIEAEEDITNTTKVSHFHNRRDSFHSLFVTDKQWARLVDIYS